MWAFLFEPRLEPTQMFFSALALFLGALDFILLRFKPWPASWVKIVNETPLPYGRGHPKVEISSCHKSLKHPLTTEGQASGRSQLKLNRVKSGYRTSPFSNLGD